MKYKRYRQPTRCNNKGLLIIPVSSIYFGQIILPIFRSTRLYVTACGIMQSRCCRPATGLQHRGCIIPQAVTHSPVLLKMGKMIARNMLNWLKLLISSYFCNYLVVYIVYINDARSSNY